jgi:hypothetical protein
MWSWQTWFTSPNSCVFTLSDQLQVLEKMNDVTKVPDSIKKVQSSVEKSSIFIVTSFQKHN